MDGFGEGGHVEEIIARDEGSWRQDFAVQLFHDCVGYFGACVGYFGDTVYAAGWTDKS